MRMLQIAQSVDVSAQSIISTPSMLSTILLRSVISVRIMLSASRIVGAFLMLTIFIFSHAAPLPVFCPLDSHAKTNISDERRLLAPWVPILSWCHTSHPQTGEGDG